MDAAPDRGRLSDKWRQGQLLPPNLTSAILASADHTNLRQINPEGILVLVSQDCDLTNDSFEKEPFAETIHGIPIPPAQTGTIGPTNSPREINLPIPIGGRVRVFCFHDKNRIRFPREMLLGYEPWGVVPGAALHQLIRMILRRYDRIPLPTEFNSRLKDKRVKVEKELRELLKRNAESLSGTSIYIHLSPAEEAGSDQPYLVYPVAVMKDTDFDDMEKREAVDTLMNSEGSEEEGVSGACRPGIVTLLRSCEKKGVAIRIADHPDLGETSMFRNACHVLRESQFTLDHLRVFRPWDFDCLSPDEDDTRPAGAASRA